MTTPAASSSVPVPASVPTVWEGVAPLADWGVIRAQGADAAQFLHGQLTQDFALLGLSEARLAGYCSAKGRLLASFIGFKRQHDEVLLLCPRSVLAATLKRLSMFVLRAQCKLSDASEQWAVWGAVGASVVTLAPQLPVAAWAKTDLSAPGGDVEHVGHVVRLPPAWPSTHEAGGHHSVSRALCVWPTAGMPLLQGGAILSVADWQWLEVTSGIAPVTAPLVDALVPQMLNYESVGGVNFKKGCYPGQEVVARSQYRGTLKRRTHRVNSTQPLEVGQAVFHPSDAEQPCGLVVAAASSPSGTHGGLVAFQLSALDGQMLQVPAAQATLSVLPLPYALRDDI